MQVIERSQVGYQQNLTAHFWLLIPDVMEGTMMSVRSISIQTISEATIELRKMGFPAPEAKKLATEIMYLHLKVEGIQEAMISYLDRKADSLAHRPIKCPVSSQDTRSGSLLLSGTSLQLERLASAIEKETPELEEFSKELRSLLKNIEKTRFAIPCRTKTLDLGDRTLIMGTINVTPDSFSDGGKLLEPESAVTRALEMAEEGADLIDVGGESTQPGSRPVDPEEELRRIIPVIAKVASRTEIPLSVDTRKARVAREALEAGAQLVNDTSALRFDPKMGEVIASYGVPVVLMHMRGTPETMQQEIHYISLISEITQYLRESIHAAHEAGVDQEKTIIDPGIGFGKTVDHNLAIIKHLAQLRTLGRPILIGPSRKSFIGKILNLDADEREEGTMATLAASILNGAHILRVHNVRNAVRVARVTDAIKGVSIPEA
jgi:dihydropteroate synthase